MTKILHLVEHYPPYKGGMSEVVRQLSQRLHSEEFDITIATTYHPDRICVSAGPKIKSFAIEGNYALGMKGPIQDFVDWVMSEEFDLISVFAAQQWTCDALLPVLGTIKAKKIFVPTGFSGLFQADYREYYQSMARWINIFDMVVFLSYDYRDINFAKEHGLSKWCVIPNGADETEFNSQSILDIRSHYKIGSADFLIATIGSHTGIKGHQECIEAFLKADINQSHLVIIGNYQKISLGVTAIIKKFLKSLLHRNKCPRCCQKWHNYIDIKNGKRISVLDINRKDTVELLKASDLFLFLSNIECSPIVLFEAMAAGVPFLSADVGNSREIAEWFQCPEMIVGTRIDKNGLSRARIDAVVNKLQDIVNHRKPYKQVGDRGKTIWNSKFTWDKIAESYSETYRRVLNEPTVIAVNGEK